MQNHVFLHPNYYNRVLVLSLKQRLEEKKKEKKKEKKERVVELIKQERSKYMCVHLYNSKCLSFLYVLQPIRRLTLLLFNIKQMMNISQSSNTGIAHFLCCTNTQRTSF